MDNPQIESWRDKIIASALAAADPTRAVENVFLSSENDAININELIKKGYARFHIISLGKAAIPMAAGIINHYDEYIHGGVIIPKAAYEIEPETWHKRFRIIPAAHPVPDESSCLAARTIIEYLSGLGKEDFVYFLISGGGSALVTLPEADITLGDMKKLNQLLLQCGATINEINGIRKHVDQIKGGKLIIKTAPAGFCTLILSDVIGDPVDVIASGPTVYDRSTFQDAWFTLEKYALIEKLPENVKSYLQAGMDGLVEETPKQSVNYPGYHMPLIIGSNGNSLHSATKMAERLGLKVVLLSSTLTGEAREAAVWVLNQAKQYLEQQINPKGYFCFLCGGETTVTIKGNGLGGRNLELALAAVEMMTGIKGGYFVTFATDGEDGPTDAAGAWVTSESAQKAQIIGLDIADALQRNDSYTFFEKMGQLIHTGSTGTNVNDICFLIVEQ